MELEIAPHRPCVRVVCLDAAGRVLLLRWRDPHSGSILWEPPGGGIDPGETPIQAAHRELMEETGLTAAIVEPPLLVDRDVIWKSLRHVGTEPFFLAPIDAEAPALTRDGLEEEEQINLSEYAWVHVDDLADLPDRLEPPQLAAVIAELRAAQLPG